MSNPTDLITDVPPEFIREFRDHIQGTLPMEKAQVELRQARNARVMQAAGSVQLKESLGQRVASIDPRLFFRMRYSFGHEENWLDDFLGECPELCAPGYRPKKNAMLHGKTFVNGKPV
jgi:hypothetical protein